MTNADTEADRILRSRAPRRWRVRRVRAGSEHDAGAAGVPPGLGALRDGNAGMFKKCIRCGT